MNNGRDFTIQSDQSRTTFIDVAHLMPRPIGPGELAHLRAMWWRQAALGHRLPAERDVIVINGRAV